MNRFSISLVIIILIFLTGNVGYSQYSDIDPKWGKYYDDNPTKIRNSFSSNDFITIMNFVEFNPTRKELNSSRIMLKKVLLMLDNETLNQMSIEGDYYSRTRKHDDWFELYNLTYKTITKNDWDRLCPYLIMLMKIDGLILKK
jgi:hypothetical protein